MCSFILYCDSLVHCGHVWGWCFQFHWYVYQCCCVLNALESLVSTMWLCFNIWLVLCQSVSSVSQCGLFVALPSSWGASVVICCVVHWLGC